MIELNGKYNTAKVFTDNIDNETVGQVIQLLNQPFISENTIRIMPDCHAGAGCVIGTTMTLKDKVVPNLVGVDIGCGMYALELEETELDLAKLDEVINAYIPCGFNIRDNTLSTPAYVGKIKAPINIDNAYKSLGTLGGGNHFIELDRDVVGHLWLVIHTGSRHLGIEVCKHYQDIATKKCYSAGIKEQTETMIAKLKAEGREKEISSALAEIKAQYHPIPAELCYVEGDDFWDYLHDMALTQDYARENRELIAETICKHMNLHVTDSFHTVHNYIDMDKHILRKGSVSAEDGERLIIPMNMRDGSLVCIGKGNPDWNYSAPHGAGRIMSRSQAKENVSLEEFKDAMTGIYSTSVAESTIDESPQVYKPMDEIVGNIKDTAYVFSIIKPIYNFKAH